MPRSTWALTNLTGPDCSLLIVVLYRPAEPAALLCRLVETIDWPADNLLNVYSFWILVRGTLIRYYSTSL
jgi:hypothetical protein